MDNRCNRCYSEENVEKPKITLQNVNYHASHPPFNKPLIAGTVFLAFNTAHAADSCDYVITRSKTNCVYDDNKINIYTHTDINNPNNIPAYQYETDYMTTDKSVIHLDAGTTINSDATGIDEGATLGVLSDAAISVINYDYYIRTIHRVLINTNTLDRLPASPMKEPLLVLFN